MDNRNILVVLVPCIALTLGACKPRDKEEPGRARFTYEYKRPEALGPLPKELGWLSPGVAQEKMLAHTEQKALRLAETLGVKLNAASLKRRADPTNETLTLRDDRYRLKLYPLSGMVKFRDTSSYNRALPEQASLPALDDQAAMKRAREILDKLAANDLVEMDQLLLQAARISHSKARGNAGRLPGQTGRPTPGPIEILDTRVFIPRAVNGLGVSGHGVRFVFDQRGAVAGLDLLWREVKIDSSRKPLPVKLGMPEAIKRFERELAVPANAQVAVEANDLVYFDPSMRDPVAFLEPGYLFVYQVRVPIKGRGEFRVSKVLHRLIPAVDHGQQQLASPRAERLQRLDRELQRARPEKASPAPTTEEGEEDESRQPLTGT